MTRGNSAYLVVFLVAVLVISGGCSYYDDYLRYAYVRNFEPSEELWDWAHSHGSPDDIIEWANANIEYDSDWNVWGIQDYWATPQETWEIRKADCESFHIFLSWALAQHLEHSTYLLIIMKHELSDGHAVTAYKNNTLWTIINHNQKLVGECLEELIQYVEDGCPDPRPYRIIGEIWEIPENRRVCAFSLCWFHFPW